MGIFLHSISVSAENTKVTFLQFLRQQNDRQKQHSVHLVKVVETKLCSIKANQRIFWSELMTLLEYQQSSIILKVNKMSHFFCHFFFTDGNLTGTKMPNPRTTTSFPGSLTFLPMWSKSGGDGKIRDPGNEITRNIDRDVLTSLNRSKKIGV